MVLVDACCSLMQVAACPKSHTLVPHAVLTFNLSVAGEQKSRLPCKISIIQKIPIILALSGFKRQKQGHLLIRDD